MSAASYLHALDGRLRVKSAAVKGSPQKALEVERELRGHNGITEVTANPTTGSVLVLYDSRQIQQNELFAALRTLGCLPEDGRDKVITKDGIMAQDGFAYGLIRTVMISAMEFAVQRLVYALI